MHPFKFFDDRVYGCGPSRYARLEGGYRRYLVFAWTFGAAMAAGRILVAVASRSELNWLEADLINGGLMQTPDHFPSSMHLGHHFCFISLFDHHHPPLSTADSRRSNTDLLTPNSVLELLAKQSMAHRRARMYAARRAPIT